MIVYPLENYNTFVSVADMSTKLTELGSGSKWDALTNKEVVLSISTAILKATCFVSDTCPFAEAQVMFIHSDLVNDSKYTKMVDQSNPYTKAKIGSLSVEYNLENSDVLPSIVKSILSGCLKDSDKPTATGFNLEFS